MKILVKRKENIFGMANFYPKNTGLPMVIWIDNLGADRKGKHNTPRLKVQNVLGNKRVDDTFTISIEEEPVVLAGRCKITSKELEEVNEFIKSNYEVLMEQWNGMIDEYELKDKIKRIK